jgi:hypothetical protein
MNTEENIFAGLPNNRIVLKAITPAHMNNPVRSWMSKAAKKVLDELTAKKKNGTLKVVNLIEHPEQDPSVNPILKAKEEKTLTHAMREMRCIVFGCKNAKRFNY